MQMPNRNEDCVPARNGWQVKPGEPQKPAVFFYFLSTGIFYHSGLLGKTRSSLSEKQTINLCH
jgi:hypothetical protein